MNWRTKKQKKLLKAIVSLKSHESAKRFLCDLMTENEIEEFSNRFYVAELLNEGVSYATIERLTGLSSATIARVSFWLNGKYGGYKEVFKKNKNKNNEF